MTSSKMKAPDIGGYDVLLVSKIPTKYKCPFCMLLMRDPIQTYRGDMACESCYVNKKGHDKVCPIDNEPITDEQFFKDNHARREIEQFECYCDNKVNGCTYVGVVISIKKHTSACEYNVISCQRCDDNILRKDINHHASEICRFRPMKCKYCSEKYDANILQEHEASCHMKPLDCPYLCGENVSMDDLYNHVEKCPKVAMGTTCPYQLVGCKYQPKSKDDMKNHLLLDTNVHIAFTGSVVQYLHQANVKLNQDLITEHTRTLELERRMEEVADGKSALGSDIQKIHDEVYEVQNQCAALKEQCDDSVKKVGNDVKEIDLRTQERSLKDIDNKLTEINKKYTQIETTLTSGQVGGISAGISSNIDSDEVKAGISRIDQLESGSAVLSANLSDLELKLQLLDNTSYGGQQLWKVDNVAYRMNQAVTGKVTALHSAPCFQRRGGYKFCSRLYLNGDGMGRGTHVSLFFVVMKSEFDALLAWPFAERVTFRLINPYNREESIRESFIPERNSSSFRRPTNDMNIAAGCPMFIRKEKLSNFIVDDVLYIETVISSDAVVN